MECSKTRGKLAVSRVRVVRAWARSAGTCPARGVPSFISWESKLRESQALDDKCRGHREVILNVPAFFRAFFSMMVHNRS